MSYLHPYPPDWKKRRLKVLNRDNWTCQQCGYEHYPQSPTQIHVHHIKPISEGGGHGYDNLEALCRSCHNIEHSNEEHPRPDSRAEYECSYCGGPRHADDTYGGSFCSPTCWSRHKAHKALNSVDELPGVCSTCYNHFPETAEACPNCGNWDANARNDELLCGSVDAINLLSQAFISWRGLR